MVWHLFVKDSLFLFSDIKTGLGQEIEYEGETFFPIGDGGVSTLSIVKRDGKFGIFILCSTGDLGGYGWITYKGGDNPFVYDEVFVSTGAEPSRSHALAVFRIGHYWGMALISPYADTDKDRVPVEILCPCIYNTKEEVQNKRSQSRWINPFQ